MWGKCTRKKNTHTPNLGACCASNKAVRSTLVFKASCSAVSGDRKHCTCFPPACWRVFWSEKTWENLRWENKAGETREQSDWCYNRTLELSLCCSYIVDKVVHQIQKNKESLKFQSLWQLSWCSPGIPLNYKPHTLYASSHCTINKTKCFGFYLQIHLWKKKKKSTQSFAPT